MPRRMEERPALEVYVSEKGYVCIKQERLHDEDVVVAIEPGQVLAVVQWLKDAQPEAQEIFEGIINDPDTE